MEKRTAINRDEVARHYKPLLPQTHKGAQGHALLVGGSYGKIGSIVLSAKAALKSGCGLVTAFVPECGYEIVQSVFPEAMVLTDVNKKYLTNIDFDIQPQAIGIGSGIGQEQATQKALHAFLKNNKTPLVVDADGLNILSANKSWLKLLPAKTILTPHQKELERLIGKSKTPDDKIRETMSFSKRYDVVVVVKGAPTLIVDGDTVFENTTGNAALATAGSGDVLTGIITGLLAQQYQPADAAIIGVYLHGLTADIAAPRTGMESFIASDIIGHLGQAFLTLG